MAVFAGALVAAPAGSAAPPANDNFANAIPIERLDDHALTNKVVSNTFEATSEVGEPQHRDADNNPASNNSSVWYSWTPDYTADSIVFVCSFVPDQFDPLLFGAYTGSSLATLTPTGTNQPVDCDGNSVLTDLFSTIQAQGGTTYHFAVAGTSDSFILGIEQPPRNDNFADAQAITGNSGLVTGDNFFSSGEAGEPSHAGSSGGQSIWYRWIAPMGGKATFNTCGSEIDTMLAVYTGAAVNSLTPVAGNDDGPTCSPQSKVSFAATKGTTYRIAVDSEVGDIGGVTLNYAEYKVPDTTITGGPAGPTNDATPTFKFGSSVPGSSFRCRFDAHLFAPCSGPGATHTPGTALTNGAHTFSVRAVNGEATDPTPATRSFIVDTVRPQTTITSGPSGVTHDNTPTFRFASSETGSTFQCLIRLASGTGTFGSCSGPGASHTPSLPLANGKYVFRVRARDKAGNVDATPANRAFTVAP